MKKLTSLLACVAAVTLTGCKSTKIKSPDGWSFSRQSLFYADSIGSLRVPIGTNYVEMKQFKSDADRALGVAEEALGLLNKAK